MCDLCSKLAALDVEVQLAELERDVVAAEVDAGWSFPGATRPLHKHEVTAAVRFGELDRITRDTAGLAARHAEDVRSRVLDALADDLADVAAKGDGTAVLARLRQLTSATNGTALSGVQAVVDAAARAILGGLQDAYRAGAGQVTAEAERQGLPEHLRPGTPTPTRGETEGLAELARRVAENPVPRVLGAAYEATSRAVRPGQPTDPYQALEAAFDAAEKASTASTEDLARQAAGQAHGAGRARAARDTPLEPKEVYASELLDSQTCGPCATVDGRTYQSLSDALDDYPSAGGFRGCLGGSRCRGTLVFVWPTEAAPTLDVAGDGRAPNEARPDRTPRGPIELPTAPEPPSARPMVLEPPPAPPAEPVNPLSMNDAELGQALTDAMAREDYELAEQLAAETDARETARGAGSAWDQAENREAEFWTAPRDVDATDIAEDVVDDWDHAKPGDRRTDDEGGMWEFNPAYGWQFVGKAGKVSKADITDRVKADWDEYLWSMQSEAEAATRGVMLRRDRLQEFLEFYGTETATAGVLFTGPANRAYYFASRELRDFWEEHPRLTWAEFAVERGITDTRLVEAAKKAPGAREDARRRAEEDADRRKERQREAAERRRRRRNFTEGTETP